jgi:hypothetical protein
MSLILSGTDGLSDVDGSAATPAIRGTDANTGIFFPAADTIAFSEGGVEAMRIDSSGNVGIGTASPANPLNVVATSNGVTRLVGVRNLSNGSGAYSIINVGNDTSALSLDIGVLSSTNVSYGGVGSSIIQANSGNMMFGTSAAYATQFITSGLERMRIDSSGNVGIGTSTPASFGAFAVRKATSVGGVNVSAGFSDAANSTFDIRHPAGNVVNLSAQGSTLTFDAGSAERMRINQAGAVLVNTTSATGSSQFVVAADTTSVNPMTVSNTRSTAATDYSILFYRNASLVGSVQTTLSATSYVTSSDYRLKEDIQPMTGALAKVAQLNPVTYKWKLDGTEAQGFIAHELQAVVPDCVTGSKDELDAEGNPKYQGIDTSFLVATLTAAIQEQQALIQSLTTRITALETQSTDNPVQGAAP